MSIQPFGFDRVFRFSSAEAEEKEGGEALHEELAAMEARIERMREDHAAELARARADGFEAGLAQARHERDAALLAATDALHAGLDDVARRFDEVTDLVAREAASVALLAAEMLAGHAVSLEPARAIDEALSRALEQVARSTQITVRVHPSMRELVEHVVAARQAAERRTLQVLVVEDPAVSPADARIGWVEGGLGVDAGARRAAVLAELAGLLGPGRDAPVLAAVETRTEVAEVSEMAEDVGSEAAEHTFEAAHQDTDHGQISGLDAAA
ncbi:flagellar assembly protein FliH [Novosphingobium sp. PhB165]|uniref:FliH/SctL family protein n=1 Tax=Novosphingobium sp. PhB165 TaxID=2485105 RepID=UPI0010D907C3|nr:FliH/SctL family protein [Novosphingobium sp. PhB165]TCM17743.1 flagellar assembly protein FliH [Novosphingobium sp. PhB165]